MKTLYTFLTLALIAFTLHLVWEWLHLPLYVGYQPTMLGMPVVLYATLGDVLYTFGVVALAIPFKRKINWIPSAGPWDYITLAVLGFWVALFVEYRGLVLGRWAYSATMPTVLGFGLSPLLQMTILLPLSVYLTNVWMKRSSR